jgi:hypothetical protein
VKPASIPAPIPVPLTMMKKVRRPSNSKLPKFPQLSPLHVSRLLQDDRFRAYVEYVLEGLLDASLGSECESVDEDEAPRKRDRIKSKAEKSHLGYDVVQRRSIFDDEELDIELGSRTLVE